MPRLASPASHVPHVLVIGGRFGGLECAKALARQPVRVTLVDRTNHHLFQPLLYQVAMAELSPAEIATPIRAVLGRHRNIEVLLGEVTALDLDAKRATLDGGDSLAFDYVVIATGVEPNWFGHDDWARHAFAIKTLDDALTMRQRVLLAFEAAERERDADARRRLLTFVVIGGGPTGVEIAGALAELGRRVLAGDYHALREQRPRIVIVEAHDRLLGADYPDTLAASARRQLEQLGVEVIVSHRVVDIDASGVKLDDGRIDSVTVLWTAGVRIRGFTAPLPVPLDRMGRVLVNADGSLPGYPFAFAVGDIANLTPAGRPAPLPGIAPVAIQMGRHAAHTIGRAVRGLPPRPFRFDDRGQIATIGRSRAVAMIRGFRLSGFIAWLTWSLVHVMYLIGFRNRLVVMIDWIWGYLTWRRGARLITEAPWLGRQRVASLAEEPRRD